MSPLTKQALATSFKKLMIKTSLEKITVKDIVTDCGVNRQTFYYHFKDIYDLLGWIYHTEAVGSISDYKTYETWQKGFLKIFHYVMENKSLCMNTFYSMGRDHLEDFLHKEISILLMGVVEEVSKGANVPIEDKKFISDFYTFAFIGLLTSWMKDGMRENPEKIIEKLDRLVSGDIEKAIKKNI